MLGNYKIFIDNILLFVIVNNININIIARRCQGSTLLKKRHFEYAMFDYRKLADVKHACYFEHFTVILSSSSSTKG